MSETKLNVGCGNERLDGWINHDVAPLPGVDVSFDLDVRPWPIRDEAVSHLRLINVLEHVRDVVGALEEIHRVCRDRAHVVVRVPYWNSPDAAADPTHHAWFSERTFDFFDPREQACRERPYYSSARFRIMRRAYYVRVGLYWRVSHPPAMWVLRSLAHHLGGIIWVLEFELLAVK